MHASHRTDHLIEDARRKCFRERVQARELPARHQIVALIQLRQEIRNLLGIILQIAIHRKDDLTPAATKAGDQRGCLPEVASEANDLHNAGILVIELAQLIKRLIGTTIIDKDYFIILLKANKLG